VERNLVGRVAIVTGAAEGIGFAVARRLAAAGARVAIADIDGAAARRAAERITQDGGAALGVAADVADERAVQEMVRQVRDELGDADILVNNAGIVGDTNDVQDFAIDAWDRALAVNLRGVFLCCRFVLPGMQAKGRGRIVNVASIAGKEGNPRMCAYSASKAGVIGFTKSLAKEVARQNILVNAVAPAVIATRLSDELEPSVLAYMVERIPMGRVGQPEEVAALIHWLCGDECSFTTGQCLDISGGRATY
jgi:NAD(P)-dependent dehydrogenase (short-subunit alcohol dehydrogenase family)